MANQKSLSSTSHIFDRHGYPRSGSWSPRSASASHSVLYLAPSTLIVQEAPLLCPWRTPWASPQGASFLGRSNFPACVASLKWLISATPEPRPGGARPSQASAISSSFSQSSSSTCHSSAWPIQMASLGNFLTGRNNFDSWLVTHLIG